MGFVGLVQFSLQCFDVLAWPLLSLVYPLCCSIRAIEANSVSDSQKLNTYWVVFSLILLFEHAFMKLLKWLPLWPYFKLIIVFWLVIPHFGGAFYVYKHLICPCLSTDLQIVVNWFNKQKKSSFNRDNVFTEVERCAHEKGPEALEKVVASKSERTKSNPDAKEWKAVSSLENKEVIQAKHNLTGTGNSKFAAMEIKEKAIEVVADRNIMKTQPLNEVQKGWTFNSHLDSKNLKNAIEAPKARNQAELRLTQIGNGALAAVEASVNPVEIATGTELIESSQTVQKEWTGALEVTIPSEGTLNSNLIRIHKASHEALNAKREAFVPKMALAKSDKHEEPGKSIPSIASKPKVIINQEVQAEEPENSIPSSGSKPKWIINPKVQAEEPENSIPSSGVKPKVIINRKVQAGEPEQSIPEALEKVVASKSERAKSNPDAKEFKAFSSLENKEVIQAKHNLTGTGNSKFAAMEIKEKAIEVVADRNIMKTPPLNEVQKGWTFNSHLDSKNLKNAIEAPKARTQAELRLTQIGNGALAAVEASVNPVEIATGRELIESSQNVPKEWTGALEVTIPSERTLNSNLIRIHKASHEALNAKREAFVPKMALAKSDKHEEPGKSIPSIASKPKVIINQEVQAEEPENSIPSSGSKPKWIINPKVQAEEPENSIPSSGVKPKVIINRKVQAGEPEQSIPEALEKVVASKSERTKSNPDAKEFKAVSSLENKEVIQAKHNLTGTGNSKFAAMEIKEKAIEVVADRNIMKTPPLNEVQKGWTFNSHLDSKNLKNAIEAPKARNQAEPRLTQIGNIALAAVEASVNPVEIATGRELIESSQNVPKEWTGALEVTIPSERTLNSNVIRIHKASHETLNVKRQAYVPKMALAKSDKHEEPGKSIPSVASKPKVIINQEVSQAEPNLTGTENSRFPSMDIKEKAIGIASERRILNIPPLEKVQEWTSAVSLVTTQSDTTFSSYPDGKIHEAVYEKLKIENKAEAKLTQMENGTFATMETQEKVVEVVTSREVIESALQVQKEWTCALCQLTTQSEATLNSHLQGRKHKAACEALKAKSWPFAPKIAPASAAKESNQPNKEQGKRTTSSASKQKVIVDEKVQSQKNSIPTSRTNTSDKSKKEWRPTTKPK